MAPEAPGNIVILDLALTDSGVRAQVDRFEPGGGDAFWVIWSATGGISAVSEEGAEPEEAGYIRAGGGVINVLAPEGSRRFQYSADIQGRDTLVWRDAVHGAGLMLVVVLPPGYVLPSVGEAVVSPTPNAFKEFKGRLAFFWRLHAHGPDQQIDVRWQMDPLGDRDLVAHRALLTESVVRMREGAGGPDIGTYVDPHPDAEPPQPASNLPIQRAAPPGVPHEVHVATSRLLTVMTHWTFATGIVVSMVGVILVILGGTGDTSFSLFGQRFESTSVGVAAIFIGIVMVVLNVRKVLNVAAGQVRREA